MISGAEVHEHEPHCRAVRALLVPVTGIVDYTQVAEKMAGLVQERGAEVLTGAQVTAIRRGGDGLTIETAKAAVQARYVINCAGLYSDRVAALMGIRPEVRIIPVPRRVLHAAQGPALAGQEPDLSRARSRVPVPRRAFHPDRARRRGGGAQCRARLRARGVHAGDGAPGGNAGDARLRRLLAMARRYWKMGTYEMYRAASKAAFVRSLQKLVPEIREADIERGGAGVRAQAVSPDGSLVDDFRISVTEGAIHVVNAPSPGATASLAIGRHIAGLAGETFRLAR